MLLKGRLEIPSHILQLGGYVGKNSIRMKDITPIEWTGCIAVTYPEFLCTLPLLSHNHCVCLCLHHNFHKQGWWNTLRGERSVAAWLGW